jgi:hypothetical protein
MIFTLVDEAKTNNPPLLCDQMHNIVVGLKLDIFPIHHLVKIPVNSIIILLANSAETAIEI